jgi:acyl-CoA reductase-like NAD-dependent aldehyde dehydrogenase
VTSSEAAFRGNLDKQFTGGDWRDGSGSKRLVDVNPYDGSPVAEFRIAGVDDIDAAYTAARDAQSRWESVNAYAYAQNEDGVVQP